MTRFLQTGCVAILLATPLFYTGCRSTAHPNQLNALDGATYDTLTAAQAATLTLRSQISASYPKYTGQFNALADSYNAALTSYAAFRAASNSDSVVLTATVGAVTVNLLALENALQADLHPKPQDVAAVQAHAHRLRAQAQANVSFADVISILEVAATVAQTIPVTAPYAALAQVVIQATSQAVTSLEAHAGKPINLSTLTPLEKL